MEGAGGVDVKELASLSLVEGSPPNKTEEEVPAAAPGPVMKVGVAKCR